MTSDVAKSAAAHKAPVIHLRAVALALTAYTCWVFADTGLKIAGASRLPALQVTALVGLAQVVLLLLYTLLRGELATLKPRNPGRQLLRACLDLFNYLCVVVALRHLPLAMFYLLVFLAPLVATVLAALFLREPLGWKQGLAVLTGFAGVVVAVDPFHSRHAGDWIGYLACLVCVACFSTNLVWARSMAQTESPQSLTLTTAAMMLAVGGTLTLPHVEPVTLFFGGVLAAAGLFCVCGSLCFFVALRHSAAATVAQYHYSQLLTGALVGYLIWRERITPTMLAGAALIVASGCYTATRFHGPARLSHPPTKGKVATESANMRDCA